MWPCGNLHTAQFMTNEKRNIKKNIYLETALFLCIVCLKMEKWVYLISVSCNGSNGSNLMNELHHGQHEFATMWWWKNLSAELIKVYQNIDKWWQKVRTILKKSVTTQADKLKY